MAEIHDLLNCLHIVVVLVNRVVTQDIHIEASAFLDHGQTDASGADHRDGLAGNFIAKKRQIGMPESPLVIACEMFRAPHFSRQDAHHEKRKLRRGFGEDIGSVGEGNFEAIGVGAVDVVEADGVLRHGFEVSLAGLKNLGINGIAQRGDEAIDAGLYFLDDETLRRRFGLGIDFDVVSSFAQQIDGFSNITSGKNAKFRSHDFLDCSGVESCGCADRSSPPTTDFASSTDRLALTP
jgi:hypothetical protein